MTQTDERRGTGAQPRRGDSVRVRSRDEILATLDADGAVNGLPFMPEMLEFAGKELRVWARADKTCDTIESSGNRRMVNTVHLAGARCDGSAHGGCQAQCLLFWREEWLEWPDAAGKPISSPVNDAESPLPQTSLMAATRAPDGDSFRCQATEHLRASVPIPRHDYGQYLADVRSRNITPGVAIRGLLLFAFNKYQDLSKRAFPRWLRIRGGHRAPFVVPTGTGERLSDGIALDGLELR